MNDNINAGCIVTTQFVTPDSGAFFGYIDYINRENAVRNEHISSYSIYADYMDNPYKTSDLFTSSSDHLSYEEKVKLQNVYSLAQERLSLMWQTVISFDNKWLEENGLYDSKTKILDDKRLMNYTRNAVNSMLKTEGLENAVWSAAIHYNTDNLHIHIATVEPIPTRQKMHFTTIKFSSAWVMEHNILKGVYRENINISMYAKKTTANEKAIFDNLKNAVGNKYNLGKSYLINEDGSIDIRIQGAIPDIPKGALIVSSVDEYRGKFKMSSIEKCRSNMVNDILGHSMENRDIMTVMRNSIVTSMRGNILLEDKEIVRQFLSVYNKLPESKRDWKYQMNKIAKLRPEIDKITDIWLNKYGSEEFTKYKTAAQNEQAKQTEAYGKNSENHYSDKQIRDLYIRCGNAILETMRNISLEDLKEYESSTYISAEIDEAAVTGEPTDFDGKINYSPTINNEKYWTDEFKAAKSDLAVALSFERDSELRNNALRNVESVFINEAENGNDIAAYELGKCYKLGTFSKIDLDKSKQYYEMAFNGFVKELNSDNWLEIMKERANFLNYLDNDITKEEIYKTLIKFDKAREKIEWNQDYLNYRVGKMLIDGEGCEKNIQEGIDYLKESETTFAFYTLGNLYYYGDDAPQNYKTAFYYFQQAGFPNKGKSMPFALYNMAEMLEKGLVINSSYNINYLYRQALDGFLSAEKKNTNDMIEYKIGTMYLEGKGCAVNKDAAEEYLFKSAVYGNTYAQTKLANLYIESENPELESKAIILLELAADSNNPMAQYQLGKIKTNMASKSFDPDEGIRLLEASAAQNNDFAEYALGSIYYKGETVEQNIDTALKHLNISAEKGNQFAEYLLGMIYLKGEDDDIKKDLQSAIDLLTRSAEQGNSFAQYQLGKLYLEEEDIRSINKAEEYLNTVSNQDNHFLQYNLGKLYLENEYIQDTDRAILHLTNSADSENQFAQYTLGMLYAENKIAQDTDKAISYLTKSAEQDNPFAALSLGNLYSKNEIIKTDKAEADKWYQKAYAEFISIEQDENIETSNSVLYQLGNMNFKGLGTKKDIYKGIDYFIKAAQQGYEHAQYALGRIYLKGDEVGKNAEYASLWLKMAADKGNSNAQYLLGKALLEEETLTQDIPAALEYLNQSTEQGNDFAQYQLGKAYYSNEYDINDIYKSLKYFTDSAEQGNEFAQYQLGLIYLKGEDIEQDTELAMKYLKLSAEQENQFAQYQLGIIYLKGEICAADISKAIEYFEASAEQNNQFSQYQLGKLYYFGAEGVETDKDKAIDCLTKSAAQGNEYAQALLNWQPSMYFGVSNRQMGFNDSMISLSSNMRQLFERLANEHEHMLNQMIHNRIEHEIKKDEAEFNQ